MFGFSGTRSIPIEYFILGDLRAEGPVVGYLAGRPIADAVVDHSGHRYRYVGLAPRCRDGQFDVGSLHSGEWIVQPGLVYVADDALSP